MSHQLKTASHEAWILHGWRKLVVFFVACDDAMTFSPQEQTDRRLSRLEQDIAALKGSRLEQGQ
jgi:DNA-binding sugar fermentation-stimulating protein